MFIKGYVRIEKTNIKNIRERKDGTKLLHTRNLLPNGKIECWVIDPRAEMTDDGKFIILKLASIDYLKPAEVDKCKK